MADPRIVIVGAGPAGMRAALTLVARGVRPVVVDEAPISGGQIYRRQPGNFTRNYSTLYGSEAGKAESLHRAFDAVIADMDYQPETLVWSVEPGRLRTVSHGDQRNIMFDRLIIASGATDRVLPMPGWTLPGVYSLGAAQIALKAQACTIGRNVVFIGTGPLLYLTAYQYLKAGVAPCVVLDVSTRRDTLKGLPGMLRRPSALLNGIGYLRALRKAGVSLKTGIVPLRAVAGTDGSVSAIIFEDGQRQRFEIPCDAIGLGYHLRAETQLADLAKCSFAFDPATRQWLPEIDAMGRSSAEGIYLAGDGVRILGADGAEISGELAAHALLEDCGYSAKKKRAGTLLRSRERHAKFAEGLALAFPWPHQLFADLPDDTIICRCEAVQLGALKDAVNIHGAHEVNRVKAFARIGMGRCQGRFCALVSQELTALARTVSVRDVSRVRGQAPIKPLPVSHCGPNDK